MTREEAVKWLKTTMDNYDFFPETEEVLKLAVEALSAECPQNDTDIGTTDKCDKCFYKRAIKDYELFGEAEPKSSICKTCKFSHYAIIVVVISNNYSCFLS